MSSEKELEISEEIADDESKDDTDEDVLAKVDKIESLCMRCGENGMTTLFMHKIPYFREIIIASFHCEECGEQNNEVTFSGEIQELGCTYELDITQASDLDRQLIKSDSASLHIPIIEFEIPAKTQKGEISTIEGFLRTAAKNLSLFQEERMAQVPEIGLKVAQIINSLELMATGNLLPFKIVLDDCAGNSFIQNPHAPAKDPHLRVAHYFRTAEQDISLGLTPAASKFHDDKDSNFMSLVTGPGFGVGGAGGQEAAPALAAAELPDDEYRSKVAETAESVKLGRSEVRLSTVFPFCPTLYLSLFSCLTIAEIISDSCWLCLFRARVHRAGR